MDKKSWLAVSLLASALAGPVRAVDSCWLTDATSPAPGVVFALCQQGRLWVTLDGGNRWTSRELHAPAAVRTLAFFAPRSGVVIGDKGLVLATGDAGQTWTARPSATKEKLLAIARSGAQMWAAGMNGAVIHTADGGRTWERQKTGTTQALEAIFFLDGQTGWAAGWSGTILRTTDGGRNWSRIQTDAGQWSIAAIRFRDARQGWAAGFGGEILRSQDGGATWKAVDSGTNAWLTSIAFDSAGHTWIAFDDGFLTSADGVHWKQEPVAGRNFLSRLLTVDGSLWAVGQSGILQRKGNQWRRIASLAVDNSMREPSLSPGEKSGGASDGGNGTGGGTGAGAGTRP